MTSDGQVVGKQDDICFVFVFEGDPARAISDSPETRADMNVMMTPSLVQMTHLAYVFVLLFGLLLPPFLLLSVSCQRFFLHFQVTLL